MARVRTTLVLLAITVAVLWAVVVVMQPRMAFFPWPGVQRTPASAGIPFQDLMIKTSDGVTLHGWWMEHPSPRARIVYWHGNGGNLSLWMDVLVDQHRRGFSVMAVDYRGYGNSTGSPTEQGMYRDVEAATRHYVEQYRRPGVRTIYWGRSLGCAAASRAAVDNAPDALVLESPFPDVKALFAGNPLMSVLAVFSTYRFDTSRHLETYRGPLLVVHGNADTVIPFAAGRQVYDRAQTAQKQFLVLEGADHNDSHAGHPRYWKDVDAFIASLP